MASDMRPYERLCLPAYALTLLLFRSMIQKITGPATRETSRAAAAPVGQVMRVDSTTCSQARPLQEAGFFRFWQK